MIIRDNFLLILHKNLCCDPLFELSQYNLDERSQQMVSAALNFFLDAFLYNLQNLFFNAQ